MGFLGRRGSMGWVRGRRSVFFFVGGAGGSERGFSGYKGACDGGEGGGSWK
jgi:hypothetical protein